MRIEKAGHGEVALAAEGLDLIRSKFHGMQDQKINLARGPCQLAAAEEVHVQVGDGFATVRTVVDYDTVTGGEFEVAGDLGGGEEQVAEEGLIFGRSFCHTCDQFFRNHQHMHGRLGLYVVDGDAVLILMRNLGGNFMVDDFLKYGLRHGVIRILNVEIRNIDRD